MLWKNLQKNLYIMKDNIILIPFGKANLTDTSG